MKLLMAAGIFIILLCVTLVGKKQINDNGQQQKSQENQITFLRKELASKLPMMNRSWDEENPIFLSEEINEDKISKLASENQLLLEKVEKIDATSILKKNQLAYTELLRQSEKVREEQKKIETAYTLTTHVNSLFEEPVLVGSKVSKDRLIKSEIQVPDINRNSELLPEMSKGFQEEIMELMNLAKEQYTIVSEIENEKNQLISDGKVIATASLEQLQAFEKLIKDVQFEKIKSRYQSTILSITERVAELSNKMRYISEVQVARRSVVAISENVSELSLKQLSQMGHIDISKGNQEIVYYLINTNVGNEDSLRYDRFATIKILDTGAYSLTLDGVTGENTFTGNIVDDISNEQWRSVRETITSMQVPKISMDNFVGIIEKSSTQALGVPNLTKDNIKPIKTKDNYIEVTISNGFSINESTDEKEEPLFNIRYYFKSGKVYYTPLGSQNDEWQYNQELTDKIWQQE